MGACEDGKGTQRSVWGRCNGGLTRGRNTGESVTEDAALGGQEGWQEDHRNTLAQWRVHQPGIAEAIATPTSPIDYVASVNAMMKAMAKEQNELRERIEVEKQRESMP